MARGINPEKVELNNINDIKNILPFHQVTSFTGFLCDYVDNNNLLTDATLIRGLRNGFDFSYEQNQLRFLEDLAYNKFNVVYIPCDREFEHISSSAIRNIEKISVDKAKQYMI